jgi:uncharacterized integral membrane protein
MQIKTIIILVLLAIVIIFVFQNTQVVEVRFIVWKASMSRALMLLGTLAIGLIAGWLLRRSGSIKS